MAWRAMSILSMPRQRVKIDPCCAVSMLNVNVNVECQCHISAYLTRITFVNDQHAEAQNWLMYAQDLGPAVSSEDNPEHA